MNRTEAAAILNVDPNASVEESRRAYQELFTEHQVRLTNAPTPALRSLYQSRLLELEEARDALLSPSLGDTNSDLPTDQPSIPVSQSRSEPPRQQAPPPPPPRREAPPPPREREKVPPPRRETPPPPREREKVPPPTATGEGSSERVGNAPKKGGKKILYGVIAGAVVIGAVVLLPSALRTTSSASSDQPQGDLSRALGNSYLDSLPPLRENVTVARVEFGRGDYDAAKSALAEADKRYAALPPQAASDTATMHLKEQMDQLHAKVQRACDALKKVAERHPGEPTCK